MKALKYAGLALALTAGSASAQDAVAIADLAKDPGAYAGKQVLISDCMVLGFNTIVGAQCTTKPMDPSMLVYIDEVPEKLHHPKEDLYLFERLKRCSPQAAALIAKLEREHTEGYALTQELSRALIRYQGTGAAGFPQFRDCVARYLDFNWRHLNCEEDELLPLARRDLTPEDWSAIDAAFAANFDPWSGPSREYAELFDRIVEMAPAPIGFGRPSSAA